MQNEQLTIVDRHGKEFILSVIKSEALKSLIEGFGSHFFAPCLYKGTWYIHEGDLELDDYNLSANIIITGNLSLHALLAEFQCYAGRLIVMGTTTANAILIETHEETHFLGGVNVNTAFLIGLSENPPISLQKFNGPFFHNHMDSIALIKPENVDCLIDSSDVKYIGQADQILKGKYIEESEDEDDYDYEIQEKAYRIKTEEIIKDIRFGKEVLKSKHIKHNYIKIRETIDLNRENIISLLKKDGLYLKELPEKYRSDPALIDIAINLNPEAFRYISNDLKDDESFVYQHIQKNGRIFKHVRPQFKKNQKFLTEAMKKTPYAFIYADETLRKNKALALQAVTEKPDILRYLNNSLRADEDILLAVIKADSHAFRFAEKSAVDNEKVILELVVADPEFLRIEPLERYQKNKKFITRALSRNPLLIHHLEPSLKNDPDILAVATKKEKKV